VSGQLEVLNKKLKQAIDTRKVLETARKQQVDTLTNFAAKLSLSCKGMDIELDNRLAKFRSALSKGVDFENLAPLITEILSLLKNQEAQQLSHQRELHTSVLTAGKLLQKTKGLPDDTRRMLRHLLDHQLNEIQSTNDFIPILNKLVSIYNQALTVKLSVSNTEDSTTQPRLAKELLTLANDLVFEDEAADNVKAIKNKISETDSVEDLLTSAIEIIRIVATNISDERQSAQSFLVSLNQTLEDLHHSIVATSKHSESMSTEFETLNKRIESKIVNLTKQTQDATSISSLKALVDNELKSLSHDLIAKERLEQEDRQALIKNFQDINTRVGSLESKLSKYKKRLHEQRFKSLLDGLTKLPNRAAFDERFNHEFHLFSVQESDFTLVVIDVDHFKSINDQYGHSAGDKTLQVIAKALQMSIRKSDFIARYGGEEFVLLMPGMSVEHATAPLEKLREAIKSIPFKFKNKSVQITVSIGATQFKKGDTPLIAFDRADDALYKAKKSGRDKLCINS